MYLFLDTETHDVENPIMIQLAYKPSDRLDYFSSLYGTGGVPIEISSMAVHHITESEIAGKPLFEETPDKDELQKLLEYLHTRRTQCCVWCRCPRTKRE
jgi:DNA polymerase III epsilon subunit-like protein